MGFYADWNGQDEEEEEGGEDGGYDRPVLGKVEYFAAGGGSAGEITARHYFSGFAVADLNLACCILAVFGFGGVAMAEFVYFIFYLPI